MDFVTWLFKHEQEWGFGYWIRVSEDPKRVEKQYSLLDIYVGQVRPIEALTSNGTVLDNTSVTVPHSLVAMVEYTGTPLTQRSIFQVFWLVLVPIISPDAVAVCGHGVGEIFTPDGSAKIIIEVFDSRSEGVQYTNEDLTHGIMEVLFSYVREDRWESSTASVEYQQDLFMSLSVVEGSERLPGSGSGYTDFVYETATS